MATTKAQRPTKAPQAPKTRSQKRSPTRPLWLYLAAAAGIVALGVVYLVSTRGSTSSPGTTAAAGLPQTSDYHSLLVSRDNSGTLILGTHQGLFRSTDGGWHWATYKLAGQDAMNLVRAGRGGVTWMAGHDVFAKSTDGGRTWQQLHPSSLPSLDLHGFTVDPRNPETLYGAVAGVGLFRSSDGGETFVKVSDVGARVMALAVTRSGELLAGDMQRGLLATRNGGKTWRQTLNAQLAGLAINPKNPQLILATGPGILRSTDGGKRWSQALKLDSGAGPVAWSPSNPKVAYVVGFNRALYRSVDSGATWIPVRG